MNSLFRRIYHEQDGQVLYLVAAALFVVLGMAALSIDIGYVMHAQRELQAATNAAAAAGGSAFSNANNVVPTAIVDEYSGDSTAGAVYNIHPDLDITSVSVSYACVTGTVATNFDMPPCATFTTLASTAGCTTGCNAIQVIEKATVPTFFGKLLGVSSFNISATASASASGGLPTPYHIMMVLDTTASMGQGTDTGCTSSGGGSYSPEQCAQLGVQTLLSELAPCASNLTSCTGNPPVDQVGVMVFPGLCSSTSAHETTSACNPPNYSATTLTNTTANATYAPPDYSCPSTSPPIAEYNNDPEYLLLGFQDNYRLSDASSLNTGSNLVESVGAGSWIGGGSNNCGVQTPGGEGTFYAGAIVAGQQYLNANHTTNVQDIMILLSDGDATSSAAQMGGTVKQTVTVGGMSNGLFSATAECTQAVNAADWAKGYTQSDGTATEIYSISYGSETSGCTSGETAPYNTPCGTMEGIASSPLSKYFFSVPQTIKGVPSTVCSGAVPITSLSQVFTTIAGQLLQSRMIPNSDF